MHKLTLVTHPHPDLDACTAIWLYCHLKGIPLSETSIRFSNSRLPNDSSFVYLDTCGGLFDHHDSNEYVCATSLVADHIGINEDPVLSCIVDYALRADHGLLQSNDTGFANPTTLIAGLHALYPDCDEEIVRKSSDFLEVLYHGELIKSKSANVLSTGIHFNTRKGKGIGCFSTSAQVAWEAHRKGYAVFVYLDPISKYAGFTTSPEYGVDFTSIFNAVSNKEPDADWFLHSSKRLLLCGSSKSPTDKTTNLTLSDLIELASSII